MESLKQASSEIALILLVILVAAAAFGLGKLSNMKQNRGTLKVSGLTASSTNNY